MCEDTGFAWPPSLGAPGLEATGEDEALAVAARLHYRSNGFPVLEADDDLRSALADEERVLAIRKTASVEHRPRNGAPPQSGRLMVTTERLMVMEDVPLTLAAFDEIDDVTLATDRLFVALSSGAGFSIQSCHPRLLRVQLAEARAARIEGQSGRSSMAGSVSPTDLPRR
jgi:hypothetical protein